jgi:hypothetical protein
VSLFVALLFFNRSTCTSKVINRDEFFKELSPVNSDSKIRDRDSASDGNDAFVSRRICRPTKFSLGVMWYNRCKISRGRLGSCHNALRLPWPVEESRNQSVLSR